ncbi:hypothetical protein SLEP1_g21891 [Rubroshorea leprosula]|uniref:Ankyrin repeat protein n=1 Tax=Rubroshorea leprosula TaxID=152421 RepID=A0AAV5JDG3_9ROSI|nr:hypothetical protein SLEP1_g21891 [Rubroshorea leprosula]
MPQEQPLRRTLSRKRSMRLGDGRDDRGWTLLHIGARKGDLKEYGSQCKLAGIFIGTHSLSSGSGNRGENKIIR